MRRPRRVNEINKGKKCKVLNCKRQATTKGYCKSHYVSNWKKMKDNTNEVTNENRH